MNTDMQAIDSRCSRCAGLIVDNHDERFCINCGHRPMTVVAAPILPNPNRQWRSELCRFCGECAAQRGYVACRACRSVG